jgi:hypothetical protein
MNIKMKVSIAGGYPPWGFSYQPGQVVEIDDKRGKSWVEGGNAVVAEKHEKPSTVHPGDPKPRKDKPAPKETAAAPGPDEKAVDPSPSKPKGKKKKS